jgi:hypothetical protein
MCADPGDLRRRAGWDGASGTSRRQLLDALQGKLDRADYFGGGFLITIGYVRLYSFGYHDTTAAVFNTSPSSEAVSTTTLRLPQLTYEFLIFFSIF